LRAKQSFQLDQAIKRLDRYEVIVIDDLSYVTCDRNETDVLFALLASRYEQRSVVITSNLVFSQWQQIFKDEMTTAAAIDRLVHHATVLELNALSYRMEHAKESKSKKITPEKIRWSRYLVIDFSHPWLKSTRQRAKCLTPTVLRPARCAERASVCLPQ
jgi:hypothetical protein